MDTQNFKNLVYHILCNGHHISIDHLANLKINQKLTTHTEIFSRNFLYKFIVFISFVRVYLKVIGLKLVITLCIQSSIYYVECGLC